MVGVDKDRKEKIVGEMIQHEVPLMMSQRRAGMSMMVNDFLLVLTVHIILCSARFVAIKHVEYSLTHCAFCQKQRKLARLCQLFAIVLFAVSAFFHMRVIVCIAVNYWIQYLVS